MKDLGFHRFFSHKVFTQLEIWRNELPEDITDDVITFQKVGRERAEAGKV